MHVSMNLTKSCFHQSHAFAKSIRQGSNFLEMLQPQLLSVAALSVSQFPARCFRTEKLGGYVAENYRAYTFLAPWMLYFLDDYKHENSVGSTEGLPPDGKPLSKWRKNELSLWLSTEQVQFNPKMTANELRGLVRMVRSTNECCDSNERRDQLMEDSNGDFTRVNTNNSIRLVRRLTKTLNEINSCVFTSDIRRKMAKN